MPTGLGRDETGLFLGLACGTFSMWEAVVIPSNASVAAAIGSTLGNEVSGTGLVAIGGLSAQEFRSKTSLSGVLRLARLLSLLFSRM